MPNAAEWVFPLKPKWSNAFENVGLYPHNALHIKIKYATSPNKGRDRPYAVEIKAAHIDHKHAVSIGMVDLIAIYMFTGFLTTTQLNMVRDLIEETCTV